MDHALRLNAIDNMNKGQMEQDSKKTNLIAQLARRKAEAQKAGGKTGNFSKFQSNKNGMSKKPLLGPAWGGRNGQGKP